MLAYFSELSAKLKPSTLWSRFSMIKSMLKIRNNVDISEYPKLNAFLKRQSDGFTSKKSKILTSDEVEKFLNEAPDDRYLATKVALIFGVVGACRREELANITLKDIEAHGDMLLIKIPNTKNKIPRSFVVEGDFLRIVQKYMNQRSQKEKTDSFFQNYQKGKCTAQAIGINKFGHMPKEIATFLGLLDAESYTGHSFRRTSATLLADSGADLTSSPSPSHVEENVRPSTSVDNDNSSGQIPSTS
ncbi:hypothetical protein ABMA28_000232 [Loxostege sticticalis]|uniref:Tyr recombinase domain-containing protein n=1 Tax=Loxostege sticticalis TaxID=481309 RepID=A0ABD0TRY3_LOXSC